MPRKPSNPFVDKYPKDIWECIQRPSSIVQHLYCCGVKEYHGIQSVYQFADKETGKVKSEPMPLSDLVDDFFARVRGNPPHRPFWIFTDNNPKTSPGEALAKYIEEHKLGTVSRSGYAKNFNSMQSVQVYVANILPEAVKHKFVA